MRKTTLAVLLAGVLAACGERIPQDALSLSPESLQRRQLQTRVFDTADEAHILAASAGVLQDLGFTIDESETDLGVIVGSKRRDAREIGQVVAATALQILGIFAGSAERVAVDDEQVIRASLVTMPAGEASQRMAVRITFQRVVWDNYGDVSRREAIDDPLIYQQFFDNLSRSAFLEAHRI